MSCTRSPGAGECWRSWRPVVAFAGRLASASQSLAQSSSEQAASIEETSSSSEEVRAMADQNVSQLQESAGEMERAARLVGQADVSLEHLSGWIGTLTDSSRNISRIIRVIDEIAFQTNILALNAAVEAARAGEAGMGFAVVADEVRNLAQRCAKAASETSGLIEETIRQSTAGKARLDDMSHVIQELTPVATSTRSRLEQVRLGSLEQTKGINQINTTMGHLGQATQAVAASAEESAAASEEIYAQAHSLGDVASALQVLAG